MPVLEILRGLPASGKTTYAVQRLDDARFRTPRGSLARVNRDDLRGRVFGTIYQSGPGSSEFEGLVTTVQHAMISTLLRAGTDVICDDTNLDPLYVEALTALAVECGATWRVHDLRWVPLAECIGRDAGRALELRVGPQRLYSMWARYIEPLEVTP